jgi:hypothetical protein
MVRKKKNSDSVFDHAFANTVVFLVCIIILSVPFLIFYAMIMYVISLTPDVRIDSMRVPSSIKIILKFFVTTVFITGIVDMFFPIMLHRSRGIFGILLKGILMFAFFYLYVLVYSFVSEEMMIQNDGYFYVSFLLFFLYLSAHVVYIAGKWLYEIIAKK